mmetsp:Transcript_23309/g.59604  ORF Transcript_23309/g.59604 Transcript_23309/m.59604 type:complete len:86 (-) Transcript_23309:1404-1661(-)
MRDVISLYRHLLQQVKTLPRSAQSYYKHFIRQHYRSHADEIDQERIQGMVARAKTDAQWILQKYSKQGVQQKTPGAAGTKGACSQ